MGAAMARNLLAAGLPMTVWDRSAVATTPLADAGAQVATSASEAVRDARVVITMLPTPDVVHDVIFDSGAAGQFAEGAAWVQMGTIGVAAAGEIADRLGQLRPDVMFVDAPVSGSKGPAEKGQLLILASGPSGAKTITDAGVLGDRSQDGMAGRGGPGQSDEAGRERLYVHPHRRRR
jgi:3-hydroxyisobutyrate dehydrogenase